MSEKNKLWILVALVIVLGITVMRWWAPESKNPVAAGGVSGTRRPAAQAPLVIPDARLQVERLETPSHGGALRVGRNIFRYEQVKRPARKVVQPKVEPVRKPPSQPPPAPPPPLRFFGMAESNVQGAVKVFLTDGNEVYIARQGDVVEGRYRVKRVTGDSLELEDLVSHRRWVLWLEVPER